MTELSGEYKVIELDKIQPNPLQPREKFNEEKLDDLARSIKTFGLLQPLCVRPIGNEKFEIVSGERRFRALKKLGHKETTVHVKELNDNQQMVQALIENIHREDLWEPEKGKTCIRIFFINGIALDPNDLKNRIMTLHNKEQGNLRRDLTDEEKKIKRVCKKVLMIPYMTVHNWISSSLVSAKIQEKEIKKEKNDRVAISVLKKMATLGTPELQEQVYKTITSSQFSTRDSVALIREVKKIEEADRQEEEELNDELEYGTEELSDCDHSLVSDEPSEEVTKTSFVVGESTKQESSGIAQKIISESRKDDLPYQLRKNMLAHQALVQNREVVRCPKCGKPLVVLEWTCCDLNFIEALKILAREYQNKITKEYS